MVMEIKFFLQKLLYYYKCCCITIEFLNCHHYDTDIKRAFLPEKFLDSCKKHKNSIVQLPQILKYRYDQAEILPASCYTH